MVSIDQCESKMRPFMQAGLAQTVCPHLGGPAYHVLRCAVVQKSPEKLQCSMTCSTMLRCGHSHCARQEYVSVMLFCSRDCALSHSMQLLSSAFCLYTVHGSAVVSSPKGLTTPFQLFQVPLSVRADMASEACWWIPTMSWTIRGHLTCQRLSM